MPRDLTRRRLALALAALVGTALLSPATAYASPGDPDPVFAGDGLWTESSYSNAPGAVGVAVDADGRVLLFGPSAGVPADTQSVLRQLLPNGDPDTSFSLDGQLEWNATTAAGSFEWPTAMELDADGLYVTLTAMYNGSLYGFHVRRWRFVAPSTTTISLANTFTSTALPNLPRDVTTDATADRNILVAGASGTLSGMVVTRIHGAGASAAMVDTSFGGTGAVVVNPEGPGFTGDAHTVVVDPTGRVLLGGASYISGVEGSYAGRWALARLLADGSLDPSFSGDGMLTLEPPQDFGAILGIALDGKGRILAAGVSQPCARAPLPPDPDTCSPAQRPRLARFKANGTLDTSFGNDGWATLPAPLGSQVGVFQTVTVDSRGWILVGGSTGLSTTVARISPQGRPDPTFGDAGAFVYDPSPTADAAAAHGGVYDLAVDGTTVVAAGFARDNGGYRWAAQQLDDSGAPPTPRGTIKKPSATPRLLKGTAGPAGQVSRVDVAVQKVDTVLLRTRHQCRWAVGTKPRFVVADAVRKAGTWTCTPPPDRWRRAGLTSGWKLTWTKALPRGRYAASARVTLATGAAKVVATRSFAVR